MPRPKNTEPSYLKHKPSGLAYVVLDGKPVYLGPHGSEASLAEYRRRLAEWKARQALGLPPQGEVRTVQDLTARFWTHAEHYYRNPDGTPTTELDSYHQSFAPLLRLYGHTLVRDFGPLALKTLQQAMADGSWMTAEERKKGKRKGRKGWARRLINQRVGRIVRAFAWGVSEQLVPVAIHQALLTVPPLARGRTKARECPQVPPADPAAVAQVLAALGPVVRAMVGLQQYTGMRPGEVCRLRPCDLDREGVQVNGVRIWVYRPAEHKGAWRGHDKAVPIGPRAQEVLKAFLDRAADAYCFSPREEVESIRAAAALKALHKTRRGVNRVAAPRRQPGQRYTVAAYGRRIRSICERLGVKWTPHMLRHLAATEVQRDYGLDGARAVLGHKDAQITLVYAARDLQKAAEIVARIG
jgi:integrase